MKLFHNNSEIVNDKTLKSYEIEKKYQLKVECDPSKKTIDIDDLNIDLRK